ncbi:MAG: type II toxin-antitoxin system VapC family toxin [Acidobacteria bacterium]|nr:type II toxin-antitoxin system VapC family toxin [Acidobacteriota bacterium]
MRLKNYFFDTHALVFWVEKENVSLEFIDFFDSQAKKGNLYVSSASIWELALLKKKGRINIRNIHEWKDDILTYSPVKMIDPTVSDMIDSTLLPDHHKDPFDRLLIAQSINNNAYLVTRDEIISKYTVKIFWL